MQRGVLRTMLGLVAVGLTVAGCGGSAGGPASTNPAAASAPSSPSELPVTPPAGSNASADGPTSVPPSGSVATDVPPAGPSPADTESAPPTPGSVDAGAPAAPEKCVAFVTGPPAGVTGPATLHVRSTSPRTAVSLTVRWGSTTTQLTTQTDGGGLAVQALDPIPPDATERVAVTVGSARCSANFPLS